MAAEEEPTTETNRTPAVLFDMQNRKARTLLGDHEQGPHFSNAAEGWRPAPGRFLFDTQNRKPGPYSATMNRVGDLGRGVRRVVDDEEPRRRRRPPPSGRPPGVAAFGAPLKLLDEAQRARQRARQRRLPRRARAWRTTPTTEMRILLMDAE
jgi:hypothetical protein